MSIIDQLVFRPCDESDPDDYRPNSSWALAIDPAKPGRPFVRDLSVSIDLVAPNDRVPLHTHPIDEVIFLAEGEAEVTCGDEVRVVSAGAVVFAPAGTPHGGGPIGDRPVRFIGFFAAERIGFTALERNPAPGTEGDPPRPTYELDVRTEVDSLA